MAKANPLLPAFNAGEISPHLYARTDLTKYRNAGEIVENMIASVEGALMRRPGTRYIAEEKSSSVKGRLMEFLASASQAYVAEFGAAAIRFYRTQGRITAANVTTTIANGTFTSGITSWSDLSTGGGSIAHDATNGRLSLLPSGTAGDDVGWAEQAVTIAVGDQGTAHVLAFRVLGAAGDLIYLRIGTTSGGSGLVADTAYHVGWHVVPFTPNAATAYVQFRNVGANNNVTIALSSGAPLNKTIQIDDVSIITNAPVELTSPYAEADLYDIASVQSVDVLYLLHNDYPVYALQRYGHSAWSLVQVAMVDGPWLEENASAHTLTFAATSGAAVNCTLSNVAAVNDGQGWLATDVGRLIRLTDNTTVNWGYGIIVGWTSTTVVTVDIRRVVVATAETRWRLGAWSDTTGWPGTGTFHEQRLMAARSIEQPTTFWGTETSGFAPNWLKYSPDSANSSGVWNGTVEDDDAFTWTISSDAQDDIEWLSAAGGRLALGTRGGEWIAESSGNVMTPTDITVKRHTAHGSARVQPINIGQLVAFVQRQQRKVRILGFSFDVDGFVAENAMRLARHMGKGGIVEMAYQQEPNAVLWCVRDDGQLLAFTFGPDEDVAGWTRCIFGGAFGTGDAVCESVAVIPGVDGAGQTASSEERDEVWVMVKRTINGATKRYVEVLEGDFDGPVRKDYATAAAWATAMKAAQEDTYYLDSCITYDGVAATTMTGLTHLEGQTIGILGDGAVQADKTVSGGAVTLDTAASVVQMGLRYAHTFKPLRFDYGSALGTAIGRVKRIVAVTLVLKDALVCKIGATVDALQTFDFRTVADTVDDPVPLYSGERFVEIEGDWETDPRVVIQDDTPAPFTLIALVPDLETREKP